MVLALAIPLWAGYLPHQPGMQFVDAEEVGLLGSKHLADVLRGSGVPFADVLRKVASGELTQKDAIMAMPKLKRVGGGRFSIL